MTRHLTNFTHGHKTIMYISKAKSFEMTTLWPLYEQKWLSKLDYFMLPVLILSPSVARPLENTVTKIDPNKSKIDFANGKSINYKTLILEPGLTPAPEKI